MKHYINPELTVVTLNTDDVITTSGTISNLWVEEHAGDSYTWDFLTGQNQ